jgi:hypothetical protein
MPDQRTRTVRQPRSAKLGASPGLVVLFSEVAIPGDGVYPAQPELTIGRSPNCGLFLEDPAMSRLHAVVRFSDGDRAVRDVGSHNGTFVNGARLAATETAVGPGDIVRCGNTLVGVVNDVGAFHGWRRWGCEGPLVGGPVVRRVLAEVSALAPTDLEVKLLETTKPTAAKAIALLEEVGVLAEATGRRRDRTFSYATYLDLLRVGTELE